MTKKIIKMLRFLRIEDDIRRYDILIRKQIFILKWKLKRKIWRFLRLAIFKFFIGNFNATSKVELTNLISFFKVYQTDKDLICLGSDGDGGYLIPNDLQGITANVSLGVAQDSNFESALADLGIHSYMADGSVEAPIIESEFFSFNKLFVGEGFTPDWISFENYMSKFVPINGDLILSMDIEGDEYDVLSDVLESTLVRFRIITIEFHDLDLIFLKSNYIQLQKIMRKLLKNHSIVHMHPNTYGPTVKYLGLEIPPVMEITLLRNDRINTRENVIYLPHNLDSKNATWMPDIILDKTWYLPNA